MGIDEHPNCVLDSLNIEHNLHCLYPWSSPPLFIILSHFSLAVKSPSIRNVILVCLTMIGYFSGFIFPFQFAPVPDLNRLDRVSPIDFPFLYRLRMPLRYLGRHLALFSRVFPPRRRGQRLFLLLIPQWDTTSSPHSSPPLHNCPRPKQPRLSGQPQHPYLTTSPQKPLCRLPGTWP